jgi:hypothetical protein
MATRRSNDGSVLGGSDRYPSAPYAWFISYRANQPHQGRRRVSIEECTARSEVEAVLRSLPRSVRATGVITKWGDEVALAERDTRGRVVWRSS